MVPGLWLERLRLREAVTVAVADWTGCPQCEFAYVQVVRLPQGRVGFVCERCGAKEGYAVAALSR